VTYFDTAYIAKCYLNEPGAERVRAVAMAADGLCSCEVARAELLCAVKRHLREGRLGRADVRRVLVRFERDERDGVWEWIPVTSELIRGACDAVRALPATAPIRALDALHLQCARERGLREIYTNDRHMAAAAAHFELRAQNVV
jgi:predicted nucleic acid-binding protein